MKRERPPWDRFARWLRRRPMNRIVGCWNAHNMPLSNFLESCGVWVPTIDIDENEGEWCMWVGHPSSLRVRPGRLPHWAAEFLDRLGGIYGEYMADFTVSDCLAILREMGRERMLAKRGIPERRAA